METWTGETADQWKIGRRGHDDGAVLFIFMQDRKVRIEVGYGLESTLTDADSYRIIQNEIRPRMRAGDVDAAVASGVAAMIVTITPSYKGVVPPSEPQQTSAEAGSIVVVVVLSLIILFVIFIIVMQVVGSIRYGYLVMREGSASRTEGHATVVVLGRQRLRGRESARHSAAVVGAVAASLRGAAASGVAALRAVGK